MMQMACPDCGGVDFSWFARVTQRGSIQKSGDDIEQVAYENGEFRPEDRDRAHCNDCRSWYDVNDLVEATVK